MPATTGIALGGSTVVDGVLDAVDPETGGDVDGRTVDVVEDFVAAEHAARKRPNATATTMRRRDIRRDESR
jgi:hypothetical protein